MSGSDFCVADSESGDDSNKSEFEDGMSEELSQSEGEGDEDARKR